MYLPKTYVTGANTVDTGLYREKYGDSEGWMDNDIYYGKKINFPCVSCPTYCWYRNGDCDSRYQGFISCPIIYALQGIKFDQYSGKSDKYFQIYDEFKNPMEYLYPPQCNGQNCTQPGCGNSFYGQPGYKHDNNDFYIGSNQCVSNQKPKYNCNKYNSANQNLFQCINNS